MPASPQGLQVRKMSEDFQEKSVLTTHSALSVNSSVLHTGPQISMTCMGIAHTLSRLPISQFLVVHPMTMTLAIKSVGRPKANKHMLLHLSPAPVISGHYRTNTFLRPNITVSLLVHCTYTSSSIGSLLATCCSAESVQPSLEARQLRRTSKKRWRGRN